MNEPTELARIMGSSLNASIDALPNKKKREKESKGKKRKVTRAVRELRDPDGLDPRDLLGL
ncbi:hypothetical protein KGQ31_03630 [Patescibacteria group bacterium]|nr:hypothetical protein [Patescibacteria group bacterium]